MRQPSAPSPSRDEALWMLTGLLVGVAVWLATDVLVAGIGVGVSLGTVFAAQERGRQGRGRGDDRAQTAAS